MKPSPLTPEELASLPIFPLPRVVFFPGSILPLHLFEQRYRDLATHCMEHGPKAMAIALLKPGYEANYEGRPNIHTVAGVGRIIEHQERQDGTHDVLLHGVARVELDELESEHSFRLGRARPLADQGSVPSAELQTLLSCATSVAAVVRTKHPEFELGLHSDDSTSQTLDTLADRFVADAAARQAILEAVELRERCERTLASVSEVLAALAATQQPS